MNTINVVLVALAVLLGGVVVAQTSVSTDSPQTTLNYDATNSRIGINTASPRASLEISGTASAGTGLLIAPSVITPTYTVTGTLAMNSNGKIGILENTTTNAYRNIVTPTLVTFVPAN